MQTRARFLRSVAAFAATPSLDACGAGTTSRSSYDSAAASLRQPLEILTERRAIQRELVRFATLAPSSHNTQCWKFELATNRISILPDFTRRCPAVDPDDHHLFVSLGAATENLVLAGLAVGKRSDVRFDPAGDGAVRIDFASVPARDSPLFRAIAHRQCTRSPYDGRPVFVNDLRSLEIAGSGRGVRVLLQTGRLKMERILSYVLRGNTTQMNDPAFLAELRSWIRFNATDAIARGDGLSSLASGNPQIPHWLGTLAMKLAFTPKSENDKYATSIRSSAGIAVFVSDASDRAHWVETGRCYERFALQATALGIRTAMVNQPVEVAPLRFEFARALDVGRNRPDLVVRFGYGPEMPQSLRRPVDAVIVGVRHA